MNDQEMNVGGGQPQNDSWQQPQGDGYGQPQNSSWQQPQGNGYGQPQNNGWQQSQGNGYGQSQYNGWQQPQGNGYQAQPGYPQQNVYQAGNPQMQGGYQNGANYNRGQYEKDPKESIGFGVASLVLGIISVLLFCAMCNVVLAILAIIFGIVQLVRSNHKGMAVGGIVAGALAIVASIVFWVLMGSRMAGMSDLYRYSNDYYYEYFLDNYGDL
ncbi:MAG: hypothetical protein K2N01_05520 [Lachnospiraceae bacterium]|nr:hypothetical protein [Lachnospiraceae bacterium]